MSEQSKHFRQSMAFSAVGLAAGVASCSDKGRQMLSAAVPSSPTQAQTSKAWTKKAPAGDRPPGVYQLQVTEIIDTEHFRKPMAARALILAGWHTEGVVVWNRGEEGCADPATFGWAVVSPDGHSRIEVISRELWDAASGERNPPSPLLLGAAPGCPQSFQRVAPDLESRSSARAARDAFAALDYSAGAQFGETAPSDRAEVWCTPNPPVRTKGNERVGRERPPSVVLKGTVSDEVRSPRLR